MHAIRLEKELLEDSKLQKAAREVTGQQLPQSLSFDSQSSPVIVDLGVTSSGNAVVHLTPREQAAASFPSDFLTKSDVPGPVLISFRVNHHGVVSVHLTVSSSISSSATSLRQSDSALIAVLAQASPHIASATVEPSVFIHDET